MTSWATITFDVDETVEMYTGPPTGLRIDSGHHEYDRLDDGRVYALSYGRYQATRYEEHVKDFASPWFNGVETAIICDVEDTGDTVTAKVWKARQLQSDERRDGMELICVYKGKRWPSEERNELIERIKRNHGVEPVIEPIETVAPPDMVVTKDLSG